MRIATVTPSDDVFMRAVALFDDYRVHYGETSDRKVTRDWLTAQLSAQRLRMSAAIAGGRVTGLVTSAVMPASLRLGAAWVVRDLFVKPEHRRGGTARALLDHVLAEARAAGALRVSLQTEPDNSPALALYAAAGFRPVDGLTTLNLQLT